MTPAAARRLFARERARFAAVFPWVAAVRLEVARRRCTGPGHCAARDLAVAQPDRGRVVLLARALALPAENVVGLLRHELGHVADRARDRPGREQRADDLAYVATGCPIRYDHALIQTVGPGTYPRPRSLHR